MRAKLSQNYASNRFGPAVHRRARQHLQPIDGDPSDAATASIEAMTAVELRFLRAAGLCRIALDGVVEAPRSRSGLRAAPEPHRSMQGTPPTQEPRGFTGARNCCF
ncbi:hypothetical protein PSPO01_16579 [Paraphaeosphaeria sporulosa]